MIPTTPITGSIAFFDMGARARLVSAMMLVIPLTRSRTWQAIQTPYASGPPALIRSAWVNAASIPMITPRNAGCRMSVEMK